MPSPASDGGEDLLKHIVHRPKARMGLLQIALDERQVLAQDGDVHPVAQAIEDEGAPMRRHFRLILLMVDPVQGSQANARTRSTCREMEYSLTKPPTPPPAVVLPAV